MDFKSATDRLFDRVDHEALAGELGVSVATIRQARLSEAARANRTPPPNWREAVAALAEKQLAHYAKLLEDLKSDDGARETRTRALRARMGLE